MKKTFVLILFMLLAGCSKITNPTTSEESTPVVSNPTTSKTDVPTKTESKPVEEDTLAILTIGNSFSDDTMEYVAQIALSIGIKKVKLGNLYIGGCSLEQHYNNYHNNRYWYEYRTNNGNRWITTRSYSLEDALAEGDWDYISLQQSSGNSGMANTYDPYLDGLIEVIEEKCPNAQIVWNMTWAYQQNSTHSDFQKYQSNQMAMYEAIVQTVKEKVLTKDQIKIIIPNGTAIQNARTSFIGDTLTRDGYHLSYDIGRYIAGLTLVHALTGLDIKDAYSPVMSIYRDVAIEAAENAVLKPFEVTDSQVDNTPTVDLSEYELIELDLTLGYWNSTDYNNYDKIITNASNSNQFFATKQFTEEEIPVGSIIEISKGWQYRPEAWDMDEVQSSRPQNVSVKYYYVEKTFWNNMLYRAFNISKIGTPNISDLALEAQAALKIYIPKQK